MTTDNRPFNGVLEDADNIINGVRQDQYGKPEDSFDKIADYWSAYLEHRVSPHDVAMLMILLKIGRIQDKATQDTLVDIAGYAAIGSTLHPE